MKFRSIRIFELIDCFTHTLLLRPPCLKTISNKPVLYETMNPTRHTGTGVSGFYYLPPSAPKLFNFFSNFRDLVCLDLSDIQFYKFTQILANFYKIWRTMSAENKHLSVDFKK